MPLGKTLPRREPFATTEQNGCAVCCSPIPRTKDKISVSRLLPQSWRYCLAFFFVLAMTLFSAMYTHAARLPPTKKGVTSSEPSTR